MDITKETTENLRNMLGNMIAQLGQLTFFKNNIDADIKILGNDSRAINLELMKRDDAEKAENAAGAKEEDQ